MIYGFDENVLIAPYSLIISILLSLGVFSFGNIIQKYISSKEIINLKKNNYFLSSIIGIYSLIIFLYLVIIFEFYSIFFLKLISYSLIILAIINFKEYLNIIKVLKKYLVNKKSYSLNLIVLIYFCLFLISASVTTHADALDYHYLGGLNLLKFGHFNKDIMPMHLNLVSLGEIIIALGLAVKTEQFLGIIQFLSLFSLIPIFLNNNQGKYFLIFILTCPITFFLISSSKPQILFAITSLNIFSYLVKFSENLDIKELKFYVPIILTILCINSLAKYSFHLSSLLLGFYLFVVCNQQKLTSYFFKIAISVFLVLYVPFLIFRNNYFDTTLFDLFLSPLPLNIYGYDNLQSLVSGGNLSVREIFFPKSILTFSTTFGPILLSLFFMINKKIYNFKIPLILITFFIFGVFTFGSNLTRFLYEGFLWIVLLVFLTVNYKNLFFVLFSKLVYFQAFFIIGIYLFFIITIFPGSISELQKENVMKNNANGYELAEWVNNTLDEKDVLLSTHRSISFFKNKTFSDIFTWHIDLKNPNSIIYINHIKSNKINKILFFESDNKKKLYGNCIGKKLNFKEKAGREVGRNPYRKSNYYSAWIYEFKYQDLPNCLNSK